MPSAPKVADIEAKNVRLENTRLKPSFLAELGFAAIHLRRYLAEVVALLAREQAGFPPVFALDFEVLHGFLFPKLQSPHSRIIPSVVEYLITNSPHPFMLPPGTVAELVSFVSRHFPVMEELKQLGKRAEQGLVSSSELDRVKALFQRGDDASQRTDLLFDDEKSLLARTAEYLGELNSGFGRLNRLVSTARIVGMADICPDWNQRLERYQDVVPSIAARISAARSPRGIETSLSNERDAQNVVTVIALNNAIEDGVKVQTRLITETRSILNIVVDDYAHDHLSERLLDKDVVLYEYVAHRERTPFLVTTLPTAAMYCSIRAAYRNPDEALRQAKAQFRELSRAEVNILDLDATYEEAEVGTMTATKQRALVSALQTSFGRWYLPFRTALSRFAVQSTSRGLVVMPRSFSGERLLFDSRVHHQHVFAGLDFEGGADTTTGARELFKVLAVHVSVESTGELFPVRRTTFRCVPTKEELLCIREWHAEHFVSVRWEVRISIDEVVAILGRIIDALGDIQGEVSAEYELLPLGTRSPRKALVEGETKGIRRRTITRLPGGKRITPSMLVVSHEWSRGEKLFVWPERVSLETQAGDLHLSLATNGHDVGPMAVCNVNARAGVNQLLLPMLCGSHPWKWSGPTLDYFCEVVKEAVDALERNPDDAV